MAGMNFQDCRDECTGLYSLQGGSMKQIKTLFSVIVFFSILLFLFGCKTVEEGSVHRKDASIYTKAAHANVIQSLDFSDTKDFENANRGFVAPLLNDGVVKLDDGTVVFNGAAYSFSKDREEAPDTVNPSLWRKSRLNALSGLFKVSDGIYQVRGQDISNLTVIEAPEGLIIVDPLVSVETAKNAMDTYFKHRGERSIAAIIFTHNHIDHYGGVKGILSNKNISKDIEIYAPVGFLEEAVNENILAGPIMYKRSLYAYGLSLKVDEKGSVGNGLGPSPSSGTKTLAEPTDVIKGEETRNIAGLTFQFMLAPDSEAPAEMHFYIPSKKALCTAENCVQTLHNFYTLRGAKNRDVLKWVGYLNKTLDLWAKDAEILFAPHNVPIWGNAEIVEHIETYRDGLRYIHDKTLSLINQGYKFNDVGNMVKLPESLDTVWSLRGYYGSISHNARAVYNFYIGYFDGNPANLDPYSTVEEARRYVSTFGRDTLFNEAKKSFDKGDYRWASILLKYILNDNPNDRSARLLQADSFEQMGYMAESATWRGFYLTGAAELRNFEERSYTAAALFNSDTLRAMTVEMMLDHLATRLDYEKLPKEEIVFKFDFGSGDTVTVSLKNSVLNYRVNDARIPQSTIRINRKDAVKVLYGGMTLDEAIKNNSAKVDGDKNVLPHFLTFITPYDMSFPIVLSK